MYDEKIKQLLLITARDAFARADEAEMKANQAADNFRTAIRGNRSKKQIERLKTVAGVACEELIELELDASRTVIALRQFEEDHGLEAAVIELANEEPQNNETIVSTAKVRVPAKRK